MKKLILTVGLPRSGKSTWAKTTGYPIVSADAIQYAVCDKQLLPIDSFYDMSDTIAKYMIKSLFFAGHTTLIYDNCNHLKTRRIYWINWCTENEIKIEYKYFDTSMEVCQERAKGFKNSEWLVPRIAEMSNEFDRLKKSDMIWKI